MKGLAALPPDQLSALESQFPGFFFQLLISPEGKRSFPYIGSGIKNIYGLESEVFLSDADKFFSLISTEDLPEVQKALEISARDLTPYQREHRVESQSGTRRWISMKCVPTRLPHGSILWSGWAYDLSKFKNPDTNRPEESFEKVLTETKRLALVAQKTTSGVLITDTTGKINWANHSFLKMTGYAESDILGKYLHDLHGPDTDPEVSSRIKWALSDLRPFDVEILNYTKNKEHLWFHEKGDPILNSDGISGQYVIILSDVTERRQLEVKLRQAQKMEIIGRLAGGVAHDFNNILGALMLSLDSVPKNEESEPFIDESIELVKQAAKSIKRLVEFSRRQILKFQPVDLSETVTLFATQFQRTARAEINVIIELNSSYSWVLGDRGLLNEVLINLCENAVDAMPRGGDLTLSVEAVPFGIKQLTQDSERRTGSFICVSVRDSGCGMTEAVQDRLYEPFFTTKPIGKGTGLGLASVHGIVHQHKGWIEVDSEVDKGTEFRVYLPVAKQMNSPALRKGR